MENYRRAIVRLNMTSREKGGRKVPTPGGYFNCMAQIGSDVFDVRLLLDEHGPLYPGDIATIPMIFLDADRAKNVFVKGARFIVRELNIIGEGVVEDSYL